MNQSFFTFCYVNICPVYAMDILYVDVNFAALALCLFPRKREKNEIQNEKKEARY